MKRVLLGCVIFGLGLAIGGVGGWVGGKRQMAAAESPGLSPGQRPPAFTASDLNGIEQRLDRYQGKVLVLHFWATWCPFCRGEIEELKTLQTEWARQGVAVLTVNLDEDLPTVQEFVKSQGLPYPVISDRRVGLLLGQQYDVRGIPVTYIIGRDGRVVLRFNGQADLVEAVKTALQAPSPSAA